MSAERQTIVADDAAANPWQITRGKPQNQVLQSELDSLGGTRMISTVARTLVSASALTVLFGVAVQANENAYDGTWSGAISCLGPGTVVVSNGKLSGSIAGNNISASIGSDGKFSVSMEASVRGDVVAISLQGAVENTRMFAGGTAKYGATKNACNLYLNSIEPHPNSLAAKYLRENPSAIVDMNIGRRPVDPPPVYVGMGGQAASPAPAPAAGTPRLTSCELAVPAKRNNAKVQGAELLKPKLYALALGVSRYRDSSINLTFASKDACDVARWIASQEGGLYRQATVRVLYDESATRDAVLEGLEWIVRETTSKDVAMIFIAGHGVNDSTGEYFFLPHDANIDSLSRTAVPQSDIRRALLQVAGKAIMFVDTCHSGQIMAQKRSLPADINQFIDALVSADNGAIAFSASTGRQFAIEDSAWGNGAFTTALLEGLSGKADYNRDKSISMAELDLWLSERVKELTGGRQAPTTAKPTSVQDFPIAIVKQ